MTKAQDIQPPADLDGEVTPPDPDGDQSPVDTVTVKTFNGAVVRTFDLPGPVEITFSVEHTTRDGETHQPDTTVELSAAESRHVLHIGHGRKTAPKGNAS